MTEEDRELKDKLQKMYGLDSEGLLERLESADRSVDDSKFQDVEERMYEKLMERARAEADKAPPEKTGRVVRFGKRKVLLAAALVALFVFMAGATAIGEKNYFFRTFNDESLNVNVVLDNDKNLLEVSNLEEAYTRIEEQLGVQVLQIGDIPSDLKFSKLTISDFRAIIELNYKGNMVHYIIEHQETGTSVGERTDKVHNEEVYNEWLQKTISISESKLGNDELELETQLCIDKVYYRLGGVIEIDDFKKIVESLNFN